MFTVAETVSLLVMGRVLRNKMNSKQINKWQEDMVQTILQLENVFENIAKCEVNICD